VTDDPPRLLAGPIVRRAGPNGVSFWVATSRRATLVGSIYRGTDILALKGRLAIGNGGALMYELGPRLFVGLVTVRPDKGAFPTDVHLAYDVTLLWGEHGEARVSELCEIGYPPFGSMPTFIIRSGMPIRVLHASCRKSGGDGAEGVDGMATLDTIVGNAVGKHAPAELISTPTLAADRPSALYLTGDQIYADDVPKKFFPWLVSTARALCGDEIVQVGENVMDAAWIGDGERGRALHVFSSTEKARHLIAFGEFAAMYLCSFSPELSRDHNDLGAFQLADQRATQRVLANIATYMILDDHEVTDDFYIHAQWKTNAHANALARRTIANALAAFWIFQAWGNDPAVDEPPNATSSSTKSPLQSVFEALKRSRQGNSRDLEDLVFARHFDFVTPGFPRVIVVDTRTRRAFPPNEPRAPPALLDANGLDLLDDRLEEIPLEQPAILVLPAPLALLPGLELVGTISADVQGPEANDYEAWSAARQGQYGLKLRLLERLGGRAVIILSGDVHHGYVMAENFGRGTGGETTRIIQFTASALRNVVPKWKATLLRALGIGMLGTPVTHWVFERDLRPNSAYARLTHKPFRGALLDWTRLVYFTIWPTVARAQVPGARPTYVEQHTMLLRPVIESNVGELVAKNHSVATLLLHSSAKRGEIRVDETVVDLRTITIPRNLELPDGVPQPPEVLIPDSDGITFLNGAAYGRIVFAGFPVNSAEPPSGERGKAFGGGYETAAAILRLPNAVGFIEGRASQTGGEGNNQALSEGRATTLRNALLLRNVSRDRILWCGGRGSRRPFDFTPKIEVDVNRSVTLTYKIPGLPEPQQPTPVATGSKLWSIFISFDADEAALIAGSLGVGLLRDRTNDDTRVIVLPALGLGLESTERIPYIGKSLRKAFDTIAKKFGDFKISRDTGGWNDFETATPYSFSAFNRAYFRIGSIDFDVLIAGYAIARLWFPNLDVGPKPGIDIGGLQFGTIGLGGKYVEGFTWLLPRSVYRTLAPFLLP